MKEFVAIVSHNAGVITKYKDFGTQAEADAHVTTYGGKVVKDLDDDTDYWDVSSDPVKDTAKQTADINTQIALNKINELETVPRRIRESLIATSSADKHVIDEDAAIAIERGKL